jgi:MoaA/NifB/PqqE/SkfB family radical SAM enzyme
MRTFFIYATKRLLPNAFRARLIRRVQQAVHWARYADPHFPTAICLEISTFCNRTCVYCPNSTNTTPKHFMPWDTFDICLARLREINWAGPLDYNRYNEPTYDPRLAELVARTRERLPRALPRIITNGDRLTPEYIRQLIAAGVVNFSVTRHPPYSEKWDARIAALCREFPNHITYNGVIADRYDILSNRAGAVAMPDYMPITHCHTPSAGLNITMDADVLLCCADYHKQHLWGNLRDQSILEIWHAPAFARVREQVRRGTPALNICNACFGT